MKDIEKKIRLLYKKVKKEEDPTERGCEGHLRVLNSIKDDLFNKGKIGWGEFEDIQIGGILGASEEDIDEAMDEIEAQLEEIASGLGIDLDEEPHGQQHSNSPTFTIINSQSQYQEQHQNQNQNQNVIIESLKKELENELRKDSPSESNTKRILGEIIDVAKSSASQIIASVFMKILGG